MTEPDADRGHLLPDDEWDRIAAEAERLDAEAARGAQEPDDET